MSDTLSNYNRYRKDPWAFLTECVHTKDQVDKVNPVKLFPDKEYLRLLTKAWLKYPLLAVPKTRRMTISWTIISLVVWEVLFHRERFFAFVSKKEDDAHELVMRAKFIIDNIDRKKIPSDLIPKFKDKFCSLESIETGSGIRGFPQGADQLRQFTFSGIFGDECAFWEKAQDFYSASFPTIDGGGRMVLVSSPAPGFFKKLVFDAMDQAGDINVEDYHPDTLTPMQGVRMWKNRKNQFLIFELHYLADPLKRHPGYQETIKNSMPLADYLREYELHWDTFHGQPVYPEFNRQFHIAEEKLEPIAGLPMLIAFDFGLTPAAVIGQIQEDTLYIFKEYVEVNMGIERFSEKVMQDVRLRWPAHSDFSKWKCFVDPSGDFRKDTDESTCTRILAKKGFRVTLGPVAFEERRKAVANRLTKLGTGGPALQLSSKYCPMLVKGFEGGYRFDDKHVDVEPTKLRPIKDAYSHPHDALQYMCAGVQYLVDTLKRQIPRPQYFNQGRETNKGRALNG